MINNDQDLAWGSLPPSVDSVGTSSSTNTSTIALWDNPSSKWNGFDSWSAKVENYIKSGFVELFPKPGFASAVPQFQAYGQTARQTLNQYDDGDLLVTSGQLYSIVDQAAAFKRLKDATDFTIPDFVTIIDPRVPGKGFLAIEKREHIDGKTLEYQLAGEASEDCKNLFSQIKGLLAQAKGVLQGEFFVDLDNPTHWGLTNQGISKARSRMPLTQSDIIILRPVQ